MVTDLLTAVSILAAAATLAGCSQAVDGSPVEEERKIHCDLIFPPAPPSRA